MSPILFFAVAHFCVRAPVHFHSRCSLSNPHGDRLTWSVLLRTQVEKTWRSSGVTLPEVRAAMARAAKMNETREPNRRVVEAARPFLVEPGCEVAHLAVPSPVHAKPGSWVVWRSTDKEYIKRKAKRDSLNSKQKPLPLRDIDFSTLRRW